MGIKRRAANGVKWLMKQAMTTALLPIGRSRRMQLFLEMSQEMVPVVDIPVGNGTSILFFCPSYDTLFRADTLMVKEPETIRWIDSFGDGDIFWDIGANVGVYSLYAAKKKRVRVLAFEPSAGNYWVLNKNVELNRLDALVSAYCVAFCRQTSMDSFNMADTDLGGACYRFGGRAEIIDYPGLGVRGVVFHQGMIGLSVDEFIQIFDPPFPTHIKIDVDGIEGEILMGAMNTLRDDRLQSVVVEQDETAVEGMRALTELLMDCGLVLAWKAALGTDEVSKHIHNFLFARTLLREARQG